MKSNETGKYEAETEAKETKQKRGRETKQVIMKLKHKGEEDETEEVKRNETELRR